MESAETAERRIESLLSGRERFLAYIRHRIDDPELAEDILQDCLLRAFRSAPNLRDEQALLPWFFRVLRNAIVDAYRTRGSTPRMADLGAVSELEADPAEAALACDCFEALLPSIRPEYADLIRRIDIEEQPTAVVASELGITANNLKVRRHRARSALRQRLEETCRVCAEHHCLDCTCNAGA